MNNKELKIGVIGTGYVGLVTGTCFSDLGRNVTCCDIDTKKIEDLNNNIVPIYEPGLAELIENNKSRLTFTTDIKSTIEQSDIIFIAVGTPMEEDGSADLQYVLSVASSIGKYINHELYIVDKSTVPVGTAEKVRKTILKEMKKRNVDVEFSIISNPEFLKEGSAISDFMRPDRIVIGIDNDKSKKIMYDLYYPLVRDNENKLIFMDIKSAEMTKYAANSLLATKISFMNEIANICERVGANINKVRIGIGSDTRIGNKFLYAGCGYGGSCFPKDVKALIQTAKENDYSPILLQATQQINFNQKYIIAENVINFFDKLKINSSDLTFGIWGLSFKPNTDDMREAPSLYIIDTLIKYGAKIKVYDPKAMNIAKTYYFKNHKNIIYCNSKYEAIEGVDALILLTEWKEFQLPDFNKIKSLMKRQIIFDGRNQYEKFNLNEKGFYYSQIGVKNE